MLLDVLMTADKFAVESCVKLCGQLLLNLPMTLELALLYMEQATTGLRADSVRLRPLVAPAMNFIAEHFKHMNKDALWEKLFKLPVVGVVAVLSSDCLEIDSEDDIYDFLLQWVKKVSSDQRREIFNMLVRNFVRFPFLTTQKLDSILTCNDIDPAIVSELAIGALHYYKAHPPHEQAPNKFMTKRNYQTLSLKAVAFGDSSHPLSIVYLDFRRDACEAMFPDGSMHTETFFVGEKEFGMVAYCRVPQDEVFPCFGLFIGTPAPENGFTISFEIAPWLEQDKDFVRQCKRNITLSSEMSSAGWIDVFEIPWTTFISRDSPYFVNDILRLRCTVRIENK